jgi:hypothetical protein
MKVVLRPTPAAAWRSMDGRTLHTVHTLTYPLCLGRDRPLTTVDGELDPATVRGLLARASDQARALEQR